MAYIINKTNGDQLTSVPDGEIDISTSIRLVGKNYPGYGEIIAENLVGMLENFANTAAPRNPMNGQLWYDTSVSPTPVMKCYSSALAAWQSLATVSGSGSGSGGTGTTYTLPTATATVLGGVKIGAGLTITNGVISASGGSGGATTIVGLSDVSILSPTNGQVLKYNSATAKWYNGTDLSGTGGGGTTDGDTLTRIDALENSFLSLDGQISAKANYSDVITLITNSEGATATQLTTLSTSYTNLQSQVDTKASVTQLNTAISNEQQARATAITNLTSLFNSLAGGTGATVEYVNEAISSAGFASASSVTTLSSTVSGITSQLVNYSSLESTVNGVTGKWGVKINANGAISGVEMLNSTGGTSFTVAADQFKITGDTPANAKTVFSVDTNTGKIIMTADVTINGNLIVNGSITEDQIGPGAVTTTGIYSGAVSGGYNTTSASGDSLSLTISVPAGCNKFTILANPGKSVVEYLVSAESGYARQYWTATLSVDSVVATTQTGTMVWTVANPTEGSHTISLYRSPDVQAVSDAGAMVLDVTIYKR